MAIQVSIDRDRDEFAGPENETPEAPRLPRPKNLVPGSGGNIIAPTPFGELNDTQLLAPPRRQQRGADAPPRPGQTRTSDISPGSIQTRRPRINIASPDAQQNAARNRVTAPNKGELRDADFDAAALASAGIAGLDEDAVAQEKRSLSQVTFADPAVGSVAIPNFGNQRTADAANRFNAVGSSIGSQAEQRQANADPTRAQFQTQFQRGETLKDVGGFRTQARSRFRYTF